MVKQRIEKAFARLLLNWPYFGPIIAGWKVEESSIPTMATSYKELLYNPDFVGTLSDEELTGVILHEVVHCLFLHPTKLTKAEGKERTLWIWALEIVTNAATLDLAKEFSVKLPGEPWSPFDGNLPPKESYVYDTRGHNHDAVEIYQELLNKMSEINKNSKTQDQEEAKTVTSPPEALILSDDIMEASDKVDTHEATEKAIAVLENMKKTKGSLPGNLDRLLKHLTQSRIPWTRILSAFASRIVSGFGRYSWLKPNMRHPLSNEVIIPGTVKKKITPPMVVVDTSGSITDEQLREFASGIGKLFQYTNQVRIVTTDTEVNEVVNVNNIRELITNVKFKGGGGTDFRKVFTYIQKVKPAYVVFFTDGYATYPDSPPKCPVLWVMTEDHETPPFGKVVYINTKKD